MRNGPVEDYFPLENGDIPLLYYFYQAKSPLKNCLTSVTSLLGTGSLVVPRGKWPFISSCTNPRRVYRSRKWEKFGWTDGLCYFLWELES